MATVVSSILLLWIAIAGWWKALASNDKIFGLAFANSVIAAIMVGYHISPNDLTLLLLPMSLITSVFAAESIRKWLRYVIIICEISLFLPFIHVLLLRRHMYAYAAAPMLALFVATHLAIKKGSFGSIQKQ